MALYLLSLACMPTWFNFTYSFTIFHQVENHIVGAPCGVMDQMASACGEANKLLAMICQVCNITSYQKQSFLSLLDFRLNVTVLLVIDAACWDCWPCWNSQTYPGMGNWFWNKTQVGVLSYINFCFTTIS